MKKQIIQYRTHYQVFIKWESEPINISHEWGKIIILMLKNKDCPSFIDINDGIYNKFEILKVVPFRVEINEERLKAEKKLKEIQSLTQQKDG